MSGHTELPRDEDLERGTKGLRHLVADWNTASRQGEDDNVVAADVFAEVLG
jgi:hypothetical protein